MPSLSVPLSIWLNATPEERDGFYLSAGFDPMVAVQDAGTDTTTVRFSQPDPVAQPMPVIPVSTTPQAGDDLRDPPQAFSVAVQDIPSGMNGYAPTPAPALGFIAIAGRALKLILGGGGGRLTSSIWNSLPSLVRSALTQVGIGVGALIAFNGDIPFITLPGQGGDVVPFDAGSEGGVMTPGPSVDIQIASPSPLQGAQVVGSWVANGVTFYRLADGKLAVQNKKGRWKVWRPKKPIVLYADGASNLKTMLRADKALNKQAKKIAAMLNRRAPRRRTATPSSSTPIVLGNNARIVDV